MPDAAGERAYLATVGHCGVVRRGVFYGICTEECRKEQVVDVNGVDDCTTGDRHVVRDGDTGVFGEEWMGGCMLRGLGAGTFGSTLSVKTVVGQGIPGLRRSGSSSTTRDLCYCVSVLLKEDHGRR